MGYDMYIEHVPEDEDSGYFRLNIWGMSRYAQLMEQLGMVATDYPLAPWPEKPDGIDWEDVSAVRHPEDCEGQEPAKPEAVAYSKTLDEYLAWHPDPPLGIALHKFGTNDGWLVTPEEIATALESYRTHSGEEVKALLAGELDYWLKWIAYLERAQRCGGFRVH